MKKKMKKNRWRSRRNRNILKSRDRLIILDKRKIRYLR